MEDCKIFIGSEADSKQAQELFFNLGFTWSDNNSSYLELGSGFNCITAYSDEMRIAMGHGDADKEITLPELRDMVVLKRNDVGDATHIGNYNGSESLRFYLDSNRVVYIHNGHEWIDSGIYPKELKPIEKKEMKEYLRKNTDSTYSYIGPVHTDHVHDLMIEIPAGADTLVIFPYRDGINGYFWKHENNINKFIGVGVYYDDYQQFTDIEKTAEQYVFEFQLSDQSPLIVWKRESKTKEFKQPEDLPFIDNEIKIDVIGCVENLPDFTPEFPTEKEIKTDFPLNRGDVNYRVAKAFNEIRGTDLTEDDLDFIRKLIDLTVSHYTDRF